MELYLILEKVEQLSLTKLTDHGITHLNNHCKLKTNEYG